MVTKKDKQDVFSKESMKNPLLKSVFDMMDKEFSATEGREEKREPKLKERMRDESE